MEQQQRKRSNMRYTMRINAAREQVFPLLCPVREYDWIPHWQCRLIYTDSGYAEPGCVFETEFDDGFGTEIWVVTEFERNRCIAFARTGEHRVTRYRITLEADGGLTSLTWHQEITSLTETGENLVAPLASGDFARSMGKLEKLLAHYLMTGKPLRP